MRAMSECQGNMDKTTVHDASQQDAGSSTPKMEGRPDVALVINAKETTQSPSLMESSDGEMWEINQ